MEQRTFQKKLLKAVRKTYSTENESLLNLSNLDTFTDLGYPCQLLQKRCDLLEFAFPIVYPFENITVQDKVVADLGCGAGLDAFLASNLGAAKVISLDLSFSFLKKINCKNVFPIRGYIDALPFKNSRFDVVIMNGSLNLIYDKISLLEQLNVILIKNGLLVIGDFVWCGSEEEREFYKDNVDAWCWCTGGCLTEEELFFITDKFGFKLDEKEEF